MRKLSLLIYFLIFAFCNVNAQIKTLPAYLDSLQVLPYPKSFNELISPFKGKVIYIDVLASWCKPCLAEIPHSKKLDEHFKKNNIVKLYITIDNFGETDKCINLLKQESVNGYLATYQRRDSTKVVNKQYVSDLENLFIFDKNKQFVGIPRYVIIDKDGNIVNDNALRPSAGDKLKIQLEPYL